MIEAIKNRRSVRKYKNEPVGENTVAGKAEKTKEKEVEKWLRSLDGMNRLISDHIRTL